MRVSNVKLGLVAVFLFFVIASIDTCQAEIAWNEDFSKMELDGWVKEFGNWDVINNTLRAGEADPIKEACLLIHPSTIAYGTWSFDVKIEPNKAINFVLIVNNATYHEFAYDYFFEIIPVETSTLFTFDKVEGKYPETTTVLGYKREYYPTDDWRHIDITRDHDGKFSVYIDSELICESLDNNITTSEEFRIVSRSYGATVDNIMITDTVKGLMDIVFNLNNSKVIKGENYVVSTQVINKVGDPIEGAEVKVTLGNQEIAASQLLNGVYKASFNTSGLLGSVDIIVTAQKTGYLISRNTYSIEVVTPAEFVLSDLIIEPSTVQVGGTIEVSVDVSNIGGNEGSHLIELLVNDNFEDEQEVALEPNGSETVIFNITPTESGIYSVTIDNLVGSFTVESIEETTTETEESESETDTTGGIPGFPVLTMLAAIVIFYLNRKWM